MSFKSPSSSNLEEEALSEGNPVAYTEGGGQAKEKTMAMLMLFHIFILSLDIFAFVIKHKIRSEIV